MTRWPFVFVFFCLILRGAGQEAGTVGIGLDQLYADDAANKKGPLVVLTVREGSPAAKAGVEKGDLIVAVNGSPVAGRNLDDILKKEIFGPAGGVVHLIVVKVGGSEAQLTGVSQKQLYLTRVPLPPTANPASDTFYWQFPGGWQVDARYPFPLPWSPTIPYHGFEDLAFTPNFDDTASSEYHSYVFFWWLDRAPELTAGEIQSDMLMYFRGLAEQRGKNYGFTPDVSKVSANYAEDPAGARKLGGAAAKSFRGEASIYDTHGKVIPLNSEVVTALCPGSGHTVAFFGMSQEPRGQGIWVKLDAVRDGFRCSR
ncbi:MAG: PDZ domain-containing protein [Bryobacteraceae bacterium]|jgi:hypothetical protein